MGRSAFEGCKGCEDRETCEAPCGKLEAVLPGPTAGRGRRENLTGLWESTMVDAEQAERCSHKVTKYHRLVDVRTESERILFAAAEAIRYRLTDRQFEAVSLCWGLGYSMRQAAREMGIKGPVVHQHIVYARLKLAEHT